MTEQFRDKLNQIINIGDCVVYSLHNSLDIGLVVKINPKMVKIKKIEPPRKWHSLTYNRYPYDIVKIEGPIVSMFILKKSSGEK